MSDKPMAPSNLSALHSRVEAIHTALDGLQATIGPFLRDVPENPAAAEYEQGGTALQVVVARLDAIIGRVSGITERFDG